MLDYPKHVLVERWMLVTITLPPRQHTNSMFNYKLVIYLLLQLATHICFRLFKNVNIHLRRETKLSSITVDFVFY